MDAAPPALNTADFAALVIPRFLRYVRICTTSDRHREETPSSPGQWELARLLAEECAALGIAAEITDHCYLIARIPASAGLEDRPVLGLLAHLDTAEDVSGQDVKPVLGKNAAGEDIIRTDGSTLLGADDKAVIAEIMGAAEYLVKHQEIKHGPLEIIFSPDEETGKGLPCFPADRIKAGVCYTLDGEGEGEFEAECFNAFRAQVRFDGRVTHLGKARGVLVNACLMAAAFAVMLPRAESPEATDGYYGYYCATDIQGSLEHAELEILIRDFSLERARERTAALESFARAVEAQFPGGTVTVEVKSQYYNMKETIGRNPAALDKLKEAARRAGTGFTLNPIRGGTDGSRLAEWGIPAPNIFTGGREFHSVAEWASVSGMAAACRLIIELVQVWAA
jgi:tripeptide aminopeptidase